MINNYSLINVLFPLSLIIWLMVKNVIFSHKLLGLCKIHSPGEVLERWLKAPPVDLWVIIVASKIKKELSLSNIKFTQKFPL